MKMKTKTIDELSSIIEELDNIKNRIDEIHNDEEDNLRSSQRSLFDSIAVRLDIMQEDLKEEIDENEN